MVQQRPRRLQIYRRRHRFRLEEVPRQEAEEPQEEDDHGQDQEEEEAADEDDDEEEDGELSRQKPKSARFSTINQRKHAAPFSVYRYVQFVDYYFYGLHTNTHTAFTVPKSLASSPIRRKEGSCQSCSIDT